MKRLLAGLVLVCCPGMTRGASAQKSPNIMGNWLEYQRSGSRSEMVQVFQNTERVVLRWPQNNTVLYGDSSGGMRPTYDVPSRQ